MVISDGRPKSSWRARRWLQRQLNGATHPSLVSFYYLWIVFPPAEVVFVHLLCYSSPEVGDFSNFSFLNLSHELFHDREPGSHAFPS